MQLLTEGDSIQSHTDRGRLFDNLILKFYLGVFFNITWHPSTLRQPILLKHVEVSQVSFRISNRLTQPCFSDHYFDTILLFSTFFFFGIKTPWFVTVSQQTENIGQHSQVAIDLERGGELN